jgi:hypothetical protein
MKSMFDVAAREELISRMGRLWESDKASWGKMNASQMVRHCVLWQEWVLHNKRLRRVFLGRLIGGAMLKKEMASEVMRKNNPSSVELIVKDTDIDMEQERRALIGLVRDYGTYVYPAGGFVHPFFGIMTREQIGQFAYKHLDHHLRQFGR